MQNELGASCFSPAARCGTNKKGLGIVRTEPKDDEGNSQPPPWKADGESETLNCGRSRVCQNRKRKITGLGKDRDSSCRFPNRSRAPPGIEFHDGEDCPRKDGTEDITGEKNKKPSDATQRTEGFRLHLPTGTGGRGDGAFRLGLQ